MTQRPLKKKTLKKKIEGKLKNPFITLTLLKKALEIYSSDLEEKVTELKLNTGTTMRFRRYKD